MGTITKGKIGRQDIIAWDGTTTKTFSRVNSTGGTDTMTLVGNVVDALAVFGAGTAYTWATLNAAINTIGSASCTLEIAPGTWTVTDDLTFPATMTLRFPQGASFSITAAKTVTINGQIEAGPYQIFSGSGTVTLAALERIYFGHWAGSDATTGYIKVNAHQDTDGDTKVQVEESADEDKIRFDTGGTQRAVIDSNGLSVYDSSGNLIHSFGPGT